MISMIYLRTVQGRAIQKKDRLQKRPCRIEYQMTDAVIHHFVRDIGLSG